MQSFGKGHKWIHQAIGLLLSTTVATTPVVSKMAVEDPLSLNLPGGNGGRSPVRIMAPLERGGGVVSHCAWSFLTILGLVAKRREIWSSFAKLLGRRGSEVDGSLLSTDPLKDSFWLKGQEKERYIGSIIDNRQLNVPVYTMRQDERGGRAARPSHPLHAGFPPPPPPLRPIIPHAHGDEPEQARVHATENRAVVITWLTEAEVTPLNYEVFHDEIRTHTPTELRAWWRGYVEAGRDLGALLKQVDPRAGLILSGTPQENQAGRFSETQRDIRPLLWDLGLQIVHNPNSSPTQRLRYTLFLAALAERGYFPPYLSRGRFLGTILYHLDDIGRLQGLRGEEHRMQRQARLWDAYLTVRFNIIRPGLTRVNTLDQVFHHLTHAAENHATRMAHVLRAYMITRRGYNPLGEDGERMTRDAAMRFANILLNEAAFGSALPNRMQTAGHRPNGGRVAGAKDVHMVDASTTAPEQGAALASVNQHGVEASSSRSSRGLQFDSVHVPFLNDSQVQTMVVQAREEIAAYFAGEATSGATDSQPGESTNVTTDAMIESHFADKSEATAVSASPLPRSSEGEVMADQMATFASDGDAAEWESTSLPSSFLESSAAPQLNQRLLPGAYRITAMSTRGNNCFFFALTATLGYEITRDGVAGMLRDAADDAEARRMIADDILRIVADEDERLEQFPHLNAMRQIHRRNQNLYTLHDQIPVEGTGADADGRARLQGLIAQNGTRLQEMARARETYSEYIEQFVARNGAQIELPTMEHESGVIGAIGRVLGININIFQQYTNEREGNLRLRLQLTHPEAERTITLFHTNAGGYGHFDVINLTQENARAVLFQDEEMAESHTVAASESENDSNDDSEPRMRKLNRISSETRNEVIKRIKEGKCSHQKIATELRISRSSVSRIAWENGQSRHQKPLSKKQEATQKKVIELLKKGGKTYSKIADECKVSKTYVATTAKEFGVRNKPKRVSLADRQAIIERLQEGKKSQRQIAAKFNVNPWTVNKIAHEIELERITKYPLSSSRSKPTEGPISGQKRSGGASGERIAAAAEDDTTPRPSKALRLENKQPEPSDSEERMRDESEEEWDSEA